MSRCPWLVGAKPTPSSLLCRGLVSPGKVKLLLQTGKEVGGSASLLSSEPPSSLSGAELARLMQTAVVEPAWMSVPFPRWILR